MPGVYAPGAISPSGLLLRMLDREVMQAYGFSVRDMTEEKCVAELMGRYREFVGG